MFRASGIAIVAIALCSTNLAKAAEPGDPCEYSSGYMRDNDADAAYHLVCDGSQWNLSLTLHKDGPVGIGTVNPSSGLRLDVEGKVGATDYCDENGENCFTADGVGGGGAAAAGPEGAIQFNNSTALAGSVGFVYTSAGVVELTTAGTTMVGQVVKASPSQTANLQEWHNSAGAVKAHITSSGNFSNTQGKAYAEVFGEGAGAADSNSAVFGYNANASGNGSIAIGSGSKVIGSSPNGSIAIGFGATANGWASIAIGRGATSNAGQFVVGGNGFDITDFYISGANSSATAGSVRIHSPSGAGWNVQGWDLEMIVGTGTGTKGGGSFIIKTADDSGIDNNFPQPLVERLRVTQEGRVGIGKASPDFALDVVGDIAFTGDLQDVSDRRLKDNIESLPAGQLAKLTALQGVSFTMKGNDKTELGLIAQDVEPHFPELVQTRPDGTKTMSYLGFIAPLIEALKEQQGQIDALQQQIELLQYQHGEAGSGPAAGE